MPAALLAALVAAVAPPPAQAQGERAFERELYRSRHAQEVRFRAAAIQVAWGAEALCDATTQIEPFVLLSVHAMRRRLPDAELALYREVTGMDGQWRVVWADEGAPDELKPGDVVTHVNGRPLGGGGTRVEVGALLRGGSPVANDDQPFWDAMLQARREAESDHGMVLTMGDGRRLEVETQRGCAGSVTASAFDNDPDTFWRQGTARVRIPANAVIEARDDDEFRWLAAFGTYFQASEAAVAAAQRSEGLAGGFLVGKVFSIVVPGMGVLLSAAEAQAERAIAVDGVVGRADLFAGEVVAALGGDPGAGLRLSERLRERGLKVDAVLMDDLRRSNAAEHARRMRALQAAQERAAQGTPAAPATRERRPPAGLTLPPLIR